MFIVIFYWVVFIMLYLSGLFVFVKVHMDENMGERNDKKEDKEEAVEND